MNGGMINAQQQPSQPPDPAQQQQQPSPDQAQPDSQGQTFVGTIVKAGDKFMLKDTSGKSWDVDHQDVVKKFEGKQVKITGTVDADGKTIHMR
jgi:hypothetical protein